MRFAENQQCVIYLVFFAGLFVSVAAHASSENNKNDLAQLRNRIEAIQKELIGHETKKDKVVDALQKIETAISRTNRKLDTLSKKRTKIAANLLQIRSRYKQTKTRIREQQSQLSMLIFYQYLQRPLNNIRLLLDQKNPNQVARNLYYLSRLSQARSESIDILDTHIAELERLSRDIQKKQTVVQVILAEQRTQKETLNHEKNKREKLLNHISEQIAQQQQDIDKLKRDEKRLSVLIKEINSLVTDRRLHQFEGSKKRPKKDPHLFKSLKGRLSLPVKGVLINHFGSSRSGTDISWKGVFFKSSSGNTVKAVADGQIVFADWLRGFGNLMIIDHGNSYMTLYGNNETVYKQVGEKIRSGDKIATVGSSGGNLNSGLYFELRYKGKPLDPAKWLKIE